MVHTPRTPTPKSLSSPQPSSRVNSSSPFQSGKNENAVPTNLITYKGRLVAGVVCSLPGRRIPARIDPDAVSGVNNVNNNNGPVDQVC